ncbi:hypothetical protein LR48_Vigan03g221700 [Vigna angularis]|uniref:Mitochondrial import inner membrane translocase subunit TIM22 n=1 Tax=Phaseolus angularis TaxID=3914 RepID=A0A0L9U7N3_PHAAN|nr:hypothetical protein LR48_Vigan03g221700 [Vigna angularis]
MVDAAERRYLEDEDTPLMKTIKGATTGLVAGTIWGTVVATWYDVPRVERSVALPGLMRTFKMMGNYGLTFAAIGGVYIGVEQLLQNYRMKRDLVNGAVGGFVAGATILGYKACPVTGFVVTGMSCDWTASGFRLSSLACPVTDFVVTGVPSYWAASGFRGCVQHHFDDLSALP